MIDFHSHILPGIDDGSKDLHTSISILQRCIEQGVHRVIATPHFYAERDSVDRFLQRRKAAYDCLQEKLPDQSPEIFVGAEVAFFQGISRADRLKELTVNGTNLLLLEMPFSTWSKSDIEEVERLAKYTDFQVILAHLERYLLVPENKKAIEQLLEIPVIVQVNAGSLLDWKRRGKAIKLLRKSGTCVLGSDCHGLHHRAPNLPEGREIVKKKLGEVFLNQIDENGSKLLSDIRREKD